MSDSETKARCLWDEGANMAYELIGRHPELLADCPPPSDILFVLNAVNEPTTKGKAVPAKVSKISGKLIDFLDAGDKTWMLEWFTQNNGYMTPNQQHILLLQQLLLFEANENGEHRIGGWDIQEVEIIGDRLGLKWASETRGEAPDIMDSSFQWGRVGQSRINFVRAKAEQRRQAAGLPPAPKAEQSKIDLVGTAAELVNTFGLEGAQAVVAAVKGAQGIVDQDQRRQEVAPRGSATPDDWQPEQPYVGKDNVVPFIRPTGTDEDR